MEFNNYCLLILGEIENAKLIIRRITENDIKYIEAKGFYLATFLSVLTPKEIKDTFIDKKTSVIVFKLDDDSSSVELTDKDKHKHLFGEVEKTVKKQSELNKKYGSMLVLDEKALKEDYLKTLKNKIDKMGKTEKTNLLNEIFDKGIENLSSEDKEILKILSTK